MIYDISVNALNVTSEGTDLAVSITGNASSVGIGDTVRLVIGLSNLGPKSCDAKLNYKIPVGLKLLSSQGPGVYDVASGFWDAGLLSVSDSVSLDLVLQVCTPGCFNHVVDVYDNLNISNNHMVWSMICASVLGNVTSTVINSSAFDGLKPIDNGNGGSGSGSGNSGSGNGGNGGNGGGSGGAGGSGNGGKGGGNGGGSDGGDGGSITPDNTPKTQLQRDIHYIRDFTSYTPTDNTQDSGQNDNKKPNEPPKMPDWTGDPGPELTPEEYEDWGKSILKFSVEVAVLAFLEFVPMGGSATGEYLQGIKSTFLNNFKALNTISSYFNKMIRTKQISDVLTKTRKVINNPTVQKTLQAWDGFLRVAGFNYGMSVFKRGLYKLFPGQEGKVDALLLIYSSWQFVKDPEGTMNAIIDIFTSLMQGQLPDRESFEKIFIFDPAQDK